MSDAWVRSLLGGVPKSQALAEVDKLGLRIVDVLCSGTNERVGAVAESRSGLWLVVWTRAISVRADNVGEPLWSVTCGDLEAVEVVTLHCFRHGPSSVTGEQLQAAVARYRRRGRRERLVVCIGD